MYIIKLILININLLYNHKHNWHCGEETFEYLSCKVYKEYKGKHNGITTVTTCDYSQLRLIDITKWDIRRVVKSLKL